MKQRAYTEQPLAPLSSIAAVLNMDMIGRNEEIPVGGGGRFTGLLPNNMRTPFIATCIVLLASSAADARVVRLRIERREVVLNGRSFGAAGAYEKLIGTVEFGFDPSLPQKDIVVVMMLSPRNG